MHPRVISLLLLLLSPVCLAQPEIERFERNAELCEHFAGEFDPDLSSADKRRVISATNKYCGRAKRQRDALKLKYRDDEAVMERLDLYETVKSFRMAR